MHCMHCTASSAVHACSARRNEVSSCLKLHHDERVRSVSGRLWIMQFWRPDAVMLAGSADHWVFWVLLRCHVSGRSCRLSVLCTDRKVCLRTNLGSCFIVCGFSSDPSWMLRQRFMKESIWQQIQMKTEDTTTKHAAVYHGHFDTSRARTNVTRVSATNNSIATSLIRHLGCR
jgi:hypothetical protein